jgi:uncharacterized protein (TIGR02270 family)
MPNGVIGGVVSIHAQEAASLYETRAVQIRLPQTGLSSLERLDNRLLAHFDGLAVAGEQGWRVLDTELENPSLGACFAVVVRALEQARVGFLDRIFALSDDASSAIDGLIAALGWVERRHLTGVVRDLLRHEDTLRRLAGMAACAMHRTDAGLDQGPWLSDPAPAVRARAFRMVGELGLKDQASRCVAAIGDDDAECRFWACWSAVLLGNRGPALQALQRMAADSNAHRARAFRLALRAMDLSSAHSMLQDIAREPAQLRWLVQGSGIAGDPAYVPWLIGHMAKPETARLAGEAFTLITGADLDALQLWRQRPEDFESGPTDNPDDQNVGLDPDEGLMWPDQPKVEKWWRASSSRFQKDVRYFMGAPVTCEHCIDVLKNGYQRQRILAAHSLCLLEPGTPLFNTSAPAWRQQRLLAKMT